ncbi:MAG TPA: hypothetical protein DGT23_04510 [Micromonosporaceae bacterium]|nr:hypothetical protein [Micromonosporaceae bacterium]
MTTSGAQTLAIARFMRMLSVAALELAVQLEDPRLPLQAQDLGEAGLGSLQLSVAKALHSYGAEGISPRAITSDLDRGDEPNVRTALAALEKRGVAERVPGVVPQRWRLTTAYCNHEGRQ